MEPCQGGVSATDPRNLLAVVRGFRAHCRDMTNCYGNIGHVTSWIEVDGLEIDYLLVQTLADARRVIAAARVGFRKA